MAKKQKWYAYFIPATGRKGIVPSWAVCEPLVKGVVGARYRGFDAEASAREWLSAGAQYTIKPKRPPAKLAKGIYFDSGTGRGNGVEIRVTDEKGKDLLHRSLPKKDLTAFGTHGVAEATNNYGELLAAYHAIRIAQKLKLKKVFGDSKLVVEYWSRGFAKKDSVNIETLALAKKTGTLRRKFEAEGGKVALISGDDNPADLGFHR